MRGVLRVTSVMGWLSMWARSEYYYMDRTLWGRIVNFDGDGNPPGEDCHLLGHTRRPGLHGPRCARPVSIISLSDAAEHAVVGCVMYRSPILREELLRRLVHT